MRLFLLFTIFFTFSFAEFRVQNTVLTLEWLEKHPRSLYKDFYIWRFLGQNISQNEAIEAMGQVKNVNNKILFRFIDRLNDKESSHIKECMQMKGSELSSQDKDCMDLGLNTYKMTTLSINEIDRVLDKYENDKENSIYKTLKILVAPLPFTRAIASPKEDFFEVFNNCGATYRVQNFNYRFPKSFLKKISSDSKFYLTIKHIVTNDKLDNIQKSLFDIDVKDTGFKSVFLLAINAINHGKSEVAQNYLKVAREKAYYRFDIDNTLFWQYLVSKDKKYLEELADSWDINIYSLYAKESLNKKIDNVVYNINQSGFKTPYDYTNPFEWLYVLSMIEKDISDKQMNQFIYAFSDKNTLSHLAFVKEKYDGYKKAYFITPYQEYLKNMTTHRKALIYALGRQESRFIPTSISTSYAMGVMQIMPFLSLALAKEMNELYNMDMQLDPAVNIRYANRHLNFLEYRFKHPLFVAYSYNGGSGFARRMLESGLFSKKGEYEPFLSMELVNYDESKVYGKKVLANYFIYKNHFLDDDSKIKFIDLINLLKVK